MCQYPRMPESSSENAHSSEPGPVSADAQSNAAGGNRSTETDRPDSAVGRSGTAAEHSAIEHAAAAPASWWPPRRSGRYLTGAAGPGRLHGLDAARGLALLGMMSAHVGWSTCGLTTLPGLLNQAHGRSAILFAVIAGFSLGIMSGRATPHTGERLVRTRLRLLVRSALLLVLGAVLVSMNTNVAIILGFYAAWLALAIPFVSWSARRLFVLATATAVVGPLIVLMAPAALQSARLSADPSVLDGNYAPTSFFLTGFYPGAVWMAFIFLRLGLSKLDLTRASALGRLAAVGTACALVGYGAAWGLTHVLTPNDPDTFHLVSPSDPASCVSGVDPAPSSWKEGGAWDFTGSSVATLRASTESPEPAPTSTEYPLLIDPDMLLNDPGWVKKTPVDPWDGVDLHTLVSAAPHANTPLEALGSSGVAMAVIGVLQLIARRWRWAIAPLAALGSMSLTIYCGHIAVIWAAGNVIGVIGPVAGFVTGSNTFLGWLALGCTLFAMGWFVLFARGPLEHFVHVVSLRATRAPAADPDQAGRQ